MSCYCKVPHWAMSAVLCWQVLGQIPCKAAGAAAFVADGSSLNGWRAPLGEWQVAGAVKLDPAQPEKFLLIPGKGVLVNGTNGHTAELVTESEFGDVEVHVEFCISKKSNSGVYLMGEYEVQIYDSYGVAKDAYPGIECGGIYPRWINGQNVEGHSPRVNASKPPGQWQSFDIVFRAPRFDGEGRKVANARFIKVLHNGRLVHENVELEGPTRGCFWENERPIGPLRLQGDHGPVAFRNVRITSLEQK
jgi:hypothetical protein